jgi:predicted O-methyltransferase YrrM
LKEKLLNSEIDLLFIDGNHSYQGVKNDFLKYSPFVAKNGLIIIDDYTPIYTGIIKFTNETIKNNKNYEIIGVFENSILIVKKLI